MIKKKRKKNCHVMSLPEKLSCHEFAGRPLAMIFIIVQNIITWSVFLHINLLIFIEPIW